MDGQARQGVGRSLGRGVVLTAVLVEDARVL